MKAQHFKVLVLADTAKSSNQFITNIRQLKHHVIVGVRSVRKLVDGRKIAHPHKRSSASATARFEVLGVFVLVLFQTLR